VRLDAACESKFARHETFHPRYGWVKKGLDAAASSHNAFNEEDAVVSLGVGKNMVKAIHFWGLAYKVLVQSKAEGSRQTVVAPSLIGHTIFADDGWDPYGELPATHWLLHWWLLAPPSLAPVWWLAFNEFPYLEFDDVQLVEFVSDRTRDWRVNDAAIRKDVACMLRMYSGAVSSRSTFDDLIDCPSRDLGILAPGSEPGSMRFIIGSKPSLPPAVAAFACLDYIARAGGSSNTVSISRLATEAGSPGLAFKLSESALAELLEIAVRSRGDLSITSASGVPQLAFKGDAAVVGTSLLFDYYSAMSSNKCTACTGLICGPYGSERYGAESPLRLEGIAK